MFFFQSIIAPELYVQADDYAFIQNSFRKRSTGVINQDCVTDGDIEIFKYTFAQPGTACAARRT